MPEAARSGRAPETRLDVITIGRSSVDLYGKQIGSRLEDSPPSPSRSAAARPISPSARRGSASGRPSSPASATSRWAASSCEQLGARRRRDRRRQDRRRRGSPRWSSSRSRTTPPSRSSSTARTAPTWRSTRPTSTRRFIASAQAVLVTGTHFSKPNTDAAQRKAMRIARRRGRQGRLRHRLPAEPLGARRARRRRGALHQVRPGLAASADRAAGLRPDRRHRGGDADRRRRRRRARRRSAAIRALTAATLVLKRGPMGCVVFPGAIPGATRGRHRRPAASRSRCYNVLGAGDAFMAGFLRGWLRGEPLETCATWANACGAFAVSRLLCSPEYPTWEELQLFPRSTAARTTRSARTRRSTTSTGRRRAGRSRRR